MDCSPPGFSVHGDSPGKNIGVRSLSLLQGIFPTQGLNPGLLNCTWILHCLNHQGSPRILKWVAYPFSRGSSWPRNWTGVSCIAGRFFTSWAAREAQSKPHWPLTSKVLGAYLSIAGSPGWGAGCGAWASYSLGKILPLSSSCLWVTHLGIWVLIILLLCPFYLFCKFLLYVFICSRSFLLVLRSFSSMVALSIVVIFMCLWEVESSYFAMLLTLVSTTLRKPI